MQAELVARGLSRQQAAAVLDAGLPLGLRVRVASHDAQAGLFGVRASGCGLSDLPATGQSIACLHPGMPRLA